MVFTKTENLDILNNDHFIVTFVKDGIVDNVPNILLIALGEE